uniref:Uncharacterized protein n=1 Tax=Rhizophora mucronata TaxID=61149 RepID=A0A2P2J3X8_RHIMU
MWPRPNGESNRFLRVPTYTSVIN